MTDLAVIMSIYQKDRLTFIKESVESMLNQTFRDFHYYLVFDGPVPYEIDDYFISMKDERIRLYRLEKNEGLANALNFLLKIVLQNPEYKYIARMDADDISMVDRFEKQRDYLLSNSDLAAIGSWYQVINEQGELISETKLPLDHENLKKRYFLRAPFAHSSVMFHRKLIEIAGFYPTNTVLMEDNILWGYALKKGLKFANLPEYLLKFRRDKNFYKRRSGIRYGWNFIKSKTRINRSVGSTLAYTLIIFFSGLFKMLPPFLSRFLYSIR